MEAKSYPVMGILLLIISFISYQSLAYSALPTPEVFSKESAPYGIPYEEWIRKWWQFHISLPTQRHPYITSNLENCPVGNSGQVSFLTHSIQGESHYTCTIPSGHAIVLRISSGECSTPELQPDKRSPADYIKCASEGQEYLTFDVTVDGVPLKGLEQNKVLTRFFNITIPEDNVYSIKAGTYKAVAHGYFVFLKPLSAGEHNVRIKAFVNNPIDSSFNFRYDASFLLKVQ